MKDLAEDVTMQKVEQQGNRISGKDANDMIVSNEFMIAVGGMNVILIDLTSRAILGTGASSSKASCEADYDDHVCLPRG